MCRLWIPPFWFTDNDWFDGFQGLWWCGGKAPHYGQNLFMYVSDLTLTIFYTSTTAFHLPKYIFLSLQGSTLWCNLLYVFIVFISRAANRMMFLQSAHRYTAETGATDLQAPDYSMDAAVTGAVPPLKTLCIEPPSYLESMTMCHLQNMISNGQMNTEHGSEQYTSRGTSGSQQIQTPALASYKNFCKF